MKQGFSAERQGNCSRLYNYGSYGDNTVSDCSQRAKDLQPNLCEEVEVAVVALSKGESAKRTLYQQNLFKQAERP